MRPPLTIFESVCLSDCLLVDWSGGLSLDLMKSGFLWILDEFDKVKDHKKFNYHSYISLR